MGAGVVIRDYKGDVLVSLCLSKDKITSPIQAEAIALWKALKLCEELNIGKAEFERDALGVVKVVNKEEDHWEWDGQIIEDIRGVLKTKVFWTVIHTYREGNKVADF